MFYIYFYLKPHTLNVFSKGLGPTEVLKANPVSLYEWGNESSQKFNIILRRPIGVQWTRYDVKGWCQFLVSMDLLKHV